MASLLAKVDPSPTPLLDHIVILVPHAFLASPPSWLAEAFTLYPGGKHADGVTENVLVFLADGSYLELIAFVDDDVGRGGRACHRWGGQKEGTVIDWALTLLSFSDAAGGLESVTAAFKEIQRKVREVGGGIEYRDLVRGGRNRPDGKVLKWATSAAADAAGKPLEPGVLPFWCLDETPRELRVPYQDGKLAEHASGAVGVAVLQVAPPAAATTPNSGDEKSGLRPVYDVLFTKSGSGGYEGSWTGRHKPGAVHLRTDPEAKPSQGRGTDKLTIKFFTTSPDFAGRKIGGRITDQAQLEFEFVSSN
ncbi:glyoxalase-like domain-containing protein [Apiospora marii]|uniref:Glyoxalase-like domain-containing protein n=1 Tax=Apiospora marii TaxID=335849 RepID=A0ABR1SQQ8_9PEZI